MPTFAPDIATLEATAGRLPEWFTEDQAGNLNPDTFTAWTQARDAHARIPARRGRPGTALPRGHRTSPRGTVPPITAAASLRFAEPPKFATPRDAYAFRDALALAAPNECKALRGRARRSVDGLFIPGVLAHVGAKFAWATPAEVSDRADRIIEGITRKPVAPPVLGRSVVIA